MFLGFYKGLFSRIGLVGLLISACGALPVHASEPHKNLLVSVHPVALMIKSAWPQLEVTTLVAANQSPHDFVLKPSDMARLSAADAVIWMGPEFEPYLKRAIRGKVEVNVAVAADVDHSDHEGHVNESQHQHQAHKHETDDHADHGHDPHLWLDPNQILPMLTLLQTALNLPPPTEFINEFTGWKEQANRVLSPFNQSGFVSFHGAFHEWVKTFHLKQLAVVTSNPEKPVGTRHIMEVRNILASGQAACLFVEPQFQSRIVKKLHQGLDVKVINIDPMASSYKVNEGGFIKFYDELLGSFTQCLRTGLKL